jgi:hypothetical protein
MSTGAWSTQSMHLLEQTRQRCTRYLQSLEHRPVCPDAAALAKLQRLDEPLPAGPSAAEDTLALLDEIVSPATLAMAGPRFFGFVIGGSLPAALAAHWLAAVWDQNAAFAAPTPGVARLEQIALRWLLELFDLPADAAGGFVTRCYRGQFHGARRRASRRARRCRLGRRVRRSVRRPADHGHRRRGGASEPA